MLRGENKTSDPPPAPPSSISQGELSPPARSAAAHQNQIGGPGALLAPHGLASRNQTGGRQALAARSSHVVSPNSGRKMAQTGSEHAGLPLHSSQPPASYPLAEEPWENYEAAPMEDLWLVPKLFRPDAYGRHRGEGEPLVNASWLNRPYFAGFFLGGLEGDTLIAGEIDQSIGFFYGFRLGWDYDLYWGLETRLGFSELGLDFVNDPTIVGLSTDIVIWDTSLVYYPWGDSRWRPFASLGIGLVDFDYLDEDALRRSDAVVGIPLGFGLKYRHSDWITMRFEFMDNIALGERADYETMNNLSLTGGLEFRFGGSRISYFPWNPSRTLR
jgi:hypothetical protein